MVAITCATASGLRRVGDDAGARLRGVDVTALVADRGRWWAVLGSSELVRIDGASIESVARSPVACAGPAAVHRGTVWLGVDGGNLARYRAGGFEAVESFSSAPTHEAWHTPWGGPPSTWSIAADDDQLLVNVHVGGILRSTDGGVSWRPTIDLEVDVHQVSIGDDGTIWAATGTRALAASSDGGETWTFHDEGLHATYMRCAVPTSDGVLVGVSSGPFGHDAAIYRFDRRRFSPAAGLPTRFDDNIDAYRLAAARDRAAVAGPHGEVYASSDGGRRWQLVAKDLPEVRTIIVR